MKTENIRYSLIIPIYKNENNLPDLLEALKKLSNEIGKGFEVIFVVDGSPDRSFAILNETLFNLPYPAQLILHSRNFGSFTAIRSGMERVRGHFVATMAADLQEPIELIERFFGLLDRNESDIVLGQRDSRHDPQLQTLLSNIYWKLYRRFVINDIPHGGVDVFACNKKVLDIVLAIHEPNSSLIAQLFWVGFRRKFISYERQKRKVGKSAWDTCKRLRYMLDSIFSYTDFPILILLWLGAIGTLITFTIGIITLFGKMLGLILVPGYTTLTLLILFFGSLILFSNGIIGCYLWRTFENTKKRPLKVITHVVMNESQYNND